MQFGSVDNPELVDFTLPADHSGNRNVLRSKAAAPNIYVGCAKWNKGELKGFYPRGTKDELKYYAEKFNSIELNATFYNNYTPDQIKKWVEKTPDDFRFFPKVWNQISHIKRLLDFEPLLVDYLESIRAFDQKLGMVFLQLHDNFKPNAFDRLVNFIDSWPKEIPLAVELRNENWFENTKVADEVHQLFASKQITNVITDTAGRRDLLHMRLSTTSVFIRYVGANHETDYRRLDDWLDRLEIWLNGGLENLYFFVHQNIEAESPLLSAYFLKHLNERLNLRVRGPERPANPKASVQTTLFE